MSKQALVLGQLQQPFQRELQYYLEERMVQRLWAKDSSLWPQELIHSDPVLAKMDCAQGSAGLIPIIWPLPSPTDGLQRRTVFAVLSYKDDDDTEINKTISELQSNAEPLIHIRIEDPADLLTETFKWEAATILACARLASDPFDIDQSRVPRAFGREILEQLAHGNNPLQRSARITNSLLQLYADGATRSEISTLGLPEALRSFLRFATPGQHVSLIIDIPRSEELHEKFVVLRNLLSTTMVRPVLMAFGPYAGEYAEHFFRHSLPYGPSIVFTTDSLTDEPIPGANYTFGHCTSSWLSANTMPWCTGIAR